jgi:hypothetical protein
MVVATNLGKKEMAARVKAANSIQRFAVAYIFTGGT